MRLAFWRSGKGEAVLEKAAPAAPGAVTSKPIVIPGSGDPSTRSLRALLAQRGRWIVLPTVLAAVLAITAVNSITPRYKSEARILIEGHGNLALDAEAVTNQVQLLLSRDLAREIIKINKLAERPEFDLVLQGLSPLKAVTALFGIGRDPSALTPEERVMDAYYERLSVHAIDNSRVILIKFQSRDPELAARVANSLAENDFVLPQNARHEQTMSKSQLLSGELDNLRKKVAEAESRVEEFRSQSGLLVGTNNSTLSNQQIGDMNTQLNNARALKSEAETRARLVREMLQGGKPIEASELLNSELIRRLFEQRASLRVQLAEQASTLLDGHPRIKQLKAQLTDLDGQLRDEAGKISRSMDNDARIAGSRVEGLSAPLEQLKTQTTSINGQDLQLRALEREAKAQRDLLETYLAKYREANTRENLDAVPVYGRIISRATVSNTPTYPNKLPVVLISTLATLMLSAGAIATAESLRGARIASTAFAMVPEGVSDQRPAGNTAPPPDHAPALQPGPEIRIESVFGVAPELADVEQVANDLGKAGDKARKITVLGSASGEGITLTGLTLARLIARNRAVVLVDLSGSSPAVAAVSVDPAAPGLAELMLGEASFSEIITRDRLSRVHLVNAGRPGFDRALLHSPRLAVAIDALLKVYDHVLLDAAAASDLSAELLAAHSHAVVVPDPSMTPEARSSFCERLREVGFSGVTMLSKAVQASHSIERSPAGRGLSPFSAVSAAPFTSSAA
jgi:polysaccharide biosynthesis transport protein